MNYWRVFTGPTRVLPTEKPYQYVSPDGTTFIPAGKDFVTGQMRWGTKLTDLISSYGLEKTAPGRKFYVTDEINQKTYSAEVNPDGTLGSLQLFAERGGECVAQDSEGNVYIAAGQVDVYSKAGKRIGTIKVPERPIDVAFGGKDGHTLFILTHHSLYAIHTIGGK